MLLALLAAAVAAQSSAFESAQGAADGAASTPPAVRVLASDDTRLEIEVRLRPSLAEWPARTTVETRVLSFRRTDAGAPWRVERGLADDEVAGEGMLRFAESRPEAALRVLDDSIGATTGSDVTVVDLIEGDVAICVWRGEEVVEVYLADPFVPTTLGGTPGDARPIVLRRLATAEGHNGRPQIRGALIVARSGDVATATFGQQRAIADAVRFDGSRATCDLEACAAMVLQIQPDIGAEPNAPVLLYSAIARWFDRPGSRLRSSPGATTAP
jgi:hypothetical protein